MAAPVSLVLPMHPLEHAEAYRLWSVLRPLQWISVGSTSG